MSETEKPLDAEEIERIRRAAAVIFKTPEPLGPRPTRIIEMNRMVVATAAARLAEQQVGIQSVFPGLKV